VSYRLAVKPRIISEKELDQEFGVKAKLESRGGYGCHCAVFDGDFATSELAFEDEWFYSLNNLTSNDIGTVMVTGNVRCDEASVSDRLMCLIVGGNLTAGTFAIFETEVLVCGDATINVLKDHDSYLKVLGKLEIGRRTSYEDPD
jgi:hypothetical protein